MTVLLNSLLPAYVYAESAWVAGRHRTRRARPARPAPRLAPPSPATIAGRVSFRLPSRC
jgi:hypothetical protein